MTRIEPASLGGCTLIPGSTCGGGEITPLELSSFRLRVSASFGEGSLFDGPEPAWDAFPEIGAPANRPRMIATVSVVRRNKDMPVFRGCPYDMASLLDFFHSRPNASCERNVPSKSLRDARCSACGRWSRFSSIDFTSHQCVVQRLCLRKVPYAEGHKAKWARTGCAEEISTNEKPSQPD